MTENVVVVAAAIVAATPPQRLLVAQRSYPPELAGRWELPGGKVEPGEGEREALRRECREELGVDIEVGGRAGPDRPTVGVAGTLRVYWASISSGVPVAREHQALRWLTSAELVDIRWVSPGDSDVVEAIRHSLTG
jgi:8-oxo-dGTP diphosphatase